MHLVASVRLVKIKFMVGISQYQGLSFLQKAQIQTGELTHGQTDGWTDGRALPSTCSPSLCGRFLCHNCLDVSHNLMVDPSQGGLSFDDKMPLCVSGSLLACLCDYRLPFMQFIIIFFSQVALETTIEWEARLEATETPDIIISSHHTCGPKDLNFSIVNALYILFTAYIIPLIILLSNYR